MTPTRFDVAVLGGGPAGAATALVLARSGYSAVVIERSGYEAVRVGESFPPAMARLLAELGIWERFVEQGHLPSYGTLSAWGGAALHENESIFNPYGTGWHVDRVAFDAWLARVAEEAGARFLRPARLVSADEYGPSGWRVGVAYPEGEAWFRARLIVDASGRVAVLARRMGARRLNCDRLVGAVAFFEGASRNADTDHTLVEAAEHGWWYSAPLPEGRLVVAYMTDADLYASALRTCPDRWQQELERTRYTARRIDGRVLAPGGGPRIVAATSSRLDTGTGRAWLAAGDATMALDPLSSLGVYKALESGMHAAHAIHRRLSGRAGGFDAYRGWIRSGFHEYLGQRQRIYAREKRWPNSPFWRRRQVH